MPVASKPAPVIDWSRIAPPTPGLYLIATPIGNLADVTLRALHVLHRADTVYCEDTRHTRVLLERYGLEARLRPYHEHNAQEMRPEILAGLTAGAVIALVSDAGTPLISDPGYKLARAAIEAGHPVQTLPGPCAAIAALTLSGLPPDRFTFVGFLPARGAARRAALHDLGATSDSLILYEAPGRLLALLQDMLTVLGDRPAAIAREITKRFEEVRRGPLSALVDHFALSGAPKGEIVVVIGPAAANAAINRPSLDEALSAALGERSLKEAVAGVSAALGLPRREVYARALALRKTSET